MSSSSLVGLLLAAIMAISVMVVDSKIVLSELMIQPAAVSSEDGNFVELYNTESTPVVIGGTGLLVGNFLVTIGDGVTIGGNSYAILANNRNSAANGGINVTWQFDSPVTWQPSNGRVWLGQPFAMNSWEFQLEWGGASGKTFPFVAGASISYDSVRDPTYVNQTNPANWCRSTTRYGNPTTGDKGTPGKANVCTVQPTKAPTKAPTKVPTKAPTKMPTKVPTKAPTKVPTKAPTKAPTKVPTKAPTKVPTKAPVKAPTKAPATVAAPIAAPTAPVDVPSTSEPEKCGLLGFNLFCPLKFCGLFGRLFGLCNSD